MDFNVKDDRLLHPKYSTFLFDWQTIFKSLAGAKSPYQLRDIPIPSMQKRVLNKIAKVRQYWLNHIATLT